MKLYIANKNYSSWSLRPWALMKTLGLPFEETLLPFPMHGEPSGFDMVSPSGKLPVLVDGDLTVWDTMAIAEYLAEQHPAVWPVHAKARAWARSACAEMHAGFGQLRKICPMSCGVRVKLHEPLTNGLLHDLQRLQSLWTQGLQSFGGPFLAGDKFTAVDGYFCPVAFRVKSFGLPLSEPCMAYVNTLLKLPAMGEWYDSALTEPWRDPVTDAQVLAFGELMQDHRSVV